MRCAFKKSVSGKRLSKKSVSGGKRFSGKRLSGLAALPVCLLAASLAILSASFHHTEALPPVPPPEKPAVEGPHRTAVEGEASFAEDFSDAVFIGDSRTQMLQLYTGLSSADFFTAVGLMVNQADTKEVVPQEDGSKCTVLEAVAKRQYRRIYIMFGTNELGWSYPKVFRDKYVELLQTLQELQPEARIYVQTIFPVTKARSDQGTYENNENVLRFNQEIRAAAEEAGTVLLETAALFDDGAGNLPAEDATDGVHLTAACCWQWLEYLRANP